jgi:hypothetical protein
VPGDEILQRSYQLVVEPVFHQVTSVRGWSYQLAVEAVFHQVTSARG